MPELIFGVDVPTAVGDDPVTAARHAENLGFDFVSASDTRTAPDRPTTPSRC